MTWRRALPALEATLSEAGGAHPDFTRQEARALKRQLARGMAAEQKRKVREERRVQKKRRRAGL